MRGLEAEQGPHRDAHGQAPCPGVHVDAHPVAPRGHRPLGRGDATLRAQVAPQDADRVAREWRRSGEPHRRKRRPSNLAWVRRGWRASRRGGRVSLALGLLAAAALLFAAPAPAGAARLITWTTPSQFVDVSKVTFNSPPPGAAPRPPALRVNALLPDGYDGRHRFPVLYLLHGHGDSYDSWANSSRGDLLDIARGFPGIVVMPEAGTGWYTNWWDGGARGADGL